ncbi:hypothetical protein IVB12_06370 [Bradyrhizobium sp. 179]|uniref:hypothetical protein n=1 Tax=Bradyrhizobium sp. 179 TaxID=2782648 RepID=UPI001FF9B9BB|nr:hypothetical protein [Bradyrhizobium sp. 179]MCK1541614.1 hypothetical protein [Bradyrhizobium sp. 179]
MRVYDKNIEKEKREALDLWAAHLMRLLAGEASVVTMRAEWKKPDATRRARK